MGHGRVKVNALIQDEMTKQKSRNTPVMPGGNLPTGGAVAQK